MVNKKALSKPITAILLVTVLAGLFCGLYSIQYASAGPSYTISKNGNLAVVSLGGSPVYSSGNHNQAFAYAFSQVSTGGTVTIQSGIYTANGTSIVMQNCTSVQVIFESGAQFTITNGANVAVFKIVGCTNCVIINANIDGNAANQNPYWYAHGIEVWGSHNTIVTNAVIDNCATYGYFNHADSTGDTNNTIQHSIFTRCEQNGITLGSSYESGTVNSWAINNTITDSSDVGITTYGTASKIISNTVHDLWMTNNTAAHWGIAIEGGSKSLLSSNTVYNCGVGINLAKDSGVTNPVTENLIIYNTVENCAPYGIADETAGHNVITQNNVTNTLMSYLGNNMYAGIRVGAYSPISTVTGDIVSFNTIRNNNATNGYMQSAIWVVSGGSYSNYNNSIYGNVIVCNNAVGNTAIGVQTKCNFTLIEHNNIQATKAIDIEDATCFYTRVINNNVANCTTGLENDGTFTTTTLTPQRVYARGTSTTSNSVTCTLNAAPTNGQSLVAVVSTANLASTIKVSSITQTGVTWTLAVENPTYVGWQTSQHLYVAIYVGSVSTGASTSITTQLDGTADTATINVYCYNTTLTVDKTATNQGHVTDTDTGTTSTTSQANELWIGGITAGWGMTLQLSNPTNGFTLFDGQTNDRMGACYLEKFVSSTGTANSGATSSYTYTDFDGAIATFTGSTNIGAVYTSTPTVIFTVSNVDINGAVSPTTGSYQYSQSGTTIFTLTPNTYYSAVLNVNGLNVTLTNNSYELSRDGDHVIYAMFTRSGEPEPTPTPTPTATPTPTLKPSNRPTQTLNLYFTTETFTVHDTTAYGLDTSYTNNALTIPADGTGNSVTYTFKVYLISEKTETELTTTTQQPTIHIYTNYTGQLTTTWTCPQYNINFGYNAFKVVTYISFNDGATWQAQTIHISNVLLTSRLLASDWQFSIYTDVTFTETTATVAFSFGNASYPSGISNIVIQKPFESELQMWRMDRGDYVGFVLGAYIDVIGEAFYALLLLLFAGVLYFRYGHFGTIAFFFVLFGGVGGLAWLFLPTWGAAVVSALVIIGTSFLVWRILR